MIMAYKGIDFVPPKSVQQNAARALEVRAEKPMSQRGMTSVGIARARDLSNGRAVSPDTIKRMVAYFSRHEVDKGGSSWSDQGKGWQAWHGWGGNEGFSWAKRILAQMQKQDEKNMGATTTTAGVFIKPNVSSGSYDQLQRKTYNMAVSGSDAYTALARSEAQIALTGSYEGHPQGSFTFSSASFQQLQDNFYASNQVIPVNYEHVSSSNGSNPAIGWITGIYTETGSAALYASIDWVDAAAVQQIKDGQYLYVSPSINFNAVDERSGKNVGAKLLSLALTNTPFLKGMQSITVEEVSNSAYLNKEDNKMLDKNKQEVDMAYGTDSEESDSEESDSEKSDSMDMAQEDKAMLLLEVIQSAVMLALDGGISVDTDMFHIKLEDDGSVSVRGVDDSGTELEVVSTVDDIMSAMGE
jgi:hypothetical protein